MNELRNLTNAELNIYSFLLDGPADKHDIEKETLYSDRTIDRAILKLLELELISYTKQKHEKTFKKIYRVIED